jgi:hypothetical protein
LLKFEDALRRCCRGKPVRRVRDLGEATNRLVEDAVRVTRRTWV